LFLLVPRVHLLDLAGPAQVFATAADLGTTTRLAMSRSGRRSRPRRGADPGRCGVAAGRPRRPGGGSRLALAGAGDNGQLDAASPREAVRLPSGGRDGRQRVRGAFALARAGLLDGRRCTTHHDLQDELARRDPKATVVRDVLHVGDGRVITSAGIASGIDLALHLVAVRHRAGVAARIARSMVVYARRSGDEQQASAMLRHRSQLRDVVHRVQDLIDAGFTRRLALADLAAAGGVSQRTLTRLVGKATGMTPLRYQQVLRVERAEHLIGHGATVEAAARAVGFGDAWMLRRLRGRS
jgi:transcriptional regulator GlxA family with amidase domain